MLTEKDYCDFKTIRELEMLGMNVYTSFCGVEVLKHLSLYEAQKWLREEKGILLYPEKNSIGWFYTTHYNIGKVHRFKYSEEYYDSYEEALLKGIKEAVKLLKEEK